MNAARSHPMFGIEWNSIAAILVCWFGICSSAYSSDPPKQPLNVVVSFSIIGDMVQEIAGDAAKVVTLVGPNADAHIFEPSPRDIKRLNSADLVIMNGLHFDDWMVRLISSSSFKGTTVVATDGIEPRLVDGHPDPHAWQSLTHAKRYVENIRRALVLAIPAQQVAINARAQSYQQQIDALRQSVGSKIKSTQANARRVITSHDAFGYFGAEHGIEFLAPQGWSTESEASAADVAGIIDQIRSQQVHALFVENISNPRLIEQIALDTGITIGGTLYSDALSPPGTVADTYLKLYSHNAQIIAEALAH